MDTASNTVIDEIDVGGSSQGFGCFIVGEPGAPIPAVSSAGVSILCLAASRRELVVTALFSSTVKAAECCPGWPSSSGS